MGEKVKLSNLTSLVQVRNLWLLVSRGSGSVLGDARNGVEAAAAKRGLGETANPVLTLLSL
jgi:hypothetical protein